MENVNENNKSTNAYQDQLKKVSDLKKNLDNQKRIILGKALTTLPKEYSLLQSQLNEEKRKLEELKRTQFSLFEPGSTASTEVAQLTNRK